MNPLQGKIDSRDANPSLLCDGARLRPSSVSIVTKKIKKILEIFNEYLLNMLDVSLSEVPDIGLFALLEQQRLLEVRLTLQFVAAYNRGAEWGKVEACGAKWKSFPKNIVSRGPSSIRSTARVV